MLHEKLGFLFSGRHLRQSIVLITSKTESKSLFGAPAYFFHWTTGVHSPINFSAAESLNPAIPDGLPRAKGQGIKD